MDENVLTTQMIKDAVDELRKKAEKGVEEMEYYLKNRDDTEDCDLEEILWNS